jgi:hypothetical protein
MNKILTCLGILIIMFGLASCNQANLTSTDEITTTLDETTDHETTRFRDLCSYTIDVSIDNGSQVIETNFVMCVAYGDNGEEEFTADGFCYPYQQNMTDYINEMEVIDDSEALTIVWDSNITVYKIEVFDDQGVSIGEWDSLVNHPDLGPGQYIVQLSSRKTESDCVTSGHHYFILNVE